METITKYQNEGYILDKKIYNIARMRKENTFVLIELNSGVVTMVNI